MTGMEHAIEQAARVLASKWQNVSTNESLGKQRMLAHALAEAGLLAPAPLREEWGSEMRNARPDGSSHVLRARGRDNARWQIENNPEWTTGRSMRRWATDWEPVDSDEGDGRDEQ